MKKDLHVVLGKGVTILQYEILEESGLSKLMFKMMRDITLPSLQPRDLHLRTLWNALRFNPKIDSESRPGWSGYMSMVSSGDYQGKSMVHMLPITDLDSNDMHWIYSTLSFIIQQSQELEMQTPIVKFDQPLWIKANEIVHAKYINIVLILDFFIRSWVWHGVLVL